MSQAANGSSDPIRQLRKEMGFWDVLLFNIATVLGPRWVAAAAHNGTSSISLWVLAAAFFFVPSALVINELSSRFPEEGGLYVWAKEAFGDFHGFVAGWTYWIYTVFYFPGLLLASAAMSAYIIGEGAKHREMAAERWRRLNLCTLDVARGLGRVFVAAAGFRDAFDLAQRSAGVELGHRQFLVADCFRIYRTGTGFCDER